MSWLSSAIKGIGGGSLGGPIGTALGIFGAAKTLFGSKKTPQFPQYTEPVSPYDISIERLLPFLMQSVMRPQATGKGSAARGAYDKLIQEIGGRRRASGAVDAASLRAGESNAAASLAGIISSLGGEEEAGRFNRLQGLTGILQGLSQNNRIASSQAYQNAFNTWQVNQQLRQDAQKAQLQALQDLAGIFTTTGNKKPGTSPGKRPANNSLSSFKIDPGQLSFQGGYGNPWPALGTQISLRGKSLGGSVSRKSGGNTALTFGY